MQIRVLGSIDAIDSDGDNVPLGGPAQRRLLALLVAAAPEPTAVDTLIQHLWVDDDRPDDPIRTVRTYVARLRRVLGPEAVVTTTGAYALGPVAVDANRFEELVERARRLSGSPAAPDLWRQALDLWRGAAFVEFADLEPIAATAARLDELRAEATEAWFDARLAAGEARELAGDVETAISRFPLREGFRAQQMTVLARAGRQAEALRAFQAFRAELTEVGLEPGARLIELDAEIGRGEIPRSGARRVLRGYELGERIGEGAFAQVFLATQASVDRSVAIKQIRGELADQPDFIAQFEAEAQLVARLEHPHIVPLYDYWREPGSAYLVMRHLDGGSLGGRLVDGPAGLDEVVRWVGQVGAGLDAAHRAGVIHRDVKPANVLLDSDGNAYLSDFGIAVEEAGRLDPEAWLSNGSPAYAAPEQLRREGVGPAADIYALGVTVYEAITGQLPYPGETTMAGLLERQLADPIPLVRTVRPEIPAAVDTVLARATAKRPDDRYPSAGDLVADLAAAAGVEGGRVLTGIDARNPYKGLRAFDEADASDFAGRDRLVRDLLSSIGKHRLVAAVGPSGSGKSSAVRAGVVPALRSGRLPGSARWFIATMTPGSDPFGALEAALLAVAVDPPTDVRASLDGSDDGAGRPDGLTRVLRRIVPDDRELVLVIDQLEELYIGVDPVDRQRFVQHLVAAVTDERSRLRVVVTLRADFYDHPLRDAQLARLLRPATVPVLPLGADELELAITEPAASVGARFEPGLVARIVAEVNDQPGALPLLQYTLTELYDRRDGDTMTLTAYDQLGGLAGAVGQRAEEVNADLDPRQQAALRRTVGRLVNLGDGTEDTRRRVLRRELPDDAATSEVIDRFAEARLLALDRDRRTREPTVEVAHEALLRAWPRLRGWLDEDREGLRLLRHLGDSATTWDEGGRSDGDLYRAGRLESAVEWSDDPNAQLTPVEADFLARSQALANEERAAEQRTNRRLRRLLVGVGVVAVLAIIAGGVALTQRDRANDEADRASENAELAQQEAARAEQSAAVADERRSEAELTALVNQAIVEAGTRPDLALLLAVKAYQESDGSIEAQRALLATLAEAPSRIDVAQLDAFGLSCANPGRPGEALLAGQNGQLIRLSATAAELVVTEVDLGLDGGQWCESSLSPDGTRVAVQLNTGGFSLNDADTGEQLLVANPDLSLNAIAFLDDERLLADTARPPADGGHRFQVLAAATGAVLDELEWDLPVLSATETASGLFVASTFPDDGVSQLIVTDGPGGEELRRLTVPGVFGRIDTHPGTDRVVIGVGLGIGLVDVTGAEEPKLIEIAEGFGTPVFAPDATTAWVHQESGIWQYDLADGTRGERISDTFARSKWMSLAPDGRLITVLETGVAELIDVGGSGGNVVGTVGLGQGAWSGAFYPDQGIIVGIDFVTGVSSIIDASTGERSEFVQEELVTDNAAGFGGFGHSDHPEAVVGILERTMHVTLVDRAGKRVARVDLWPGDEPAALLPQPIRDLHLVSLPVAVGRSATSYLEGGPPKPDFLAVFDARTGAMVGTPVSVSGWQERPWYQVPIQPDGGLLVFDQRGQLFVYDREGEMVGEPTPMGGEVRDARVTSDGARAVVILDDGRMQVVDLDDRTITATLKAPEGQAQIRMMPDPRLMISIDGRGRALLYDLEELVEIGYLLGDRDGDFIGYSVGTDQNTVWVGQTNSWYEVPLDPEVWRRRACDLAGRELTDEEWSQFVPGDEPRQDLCT